MRIKRKIIRHGFFWLPNSKKEVKGTLIILDGGKISLRLENLLHPQNELIKIIHGRIGETAITLVDSYCKVYNDLISMISGGYGFEMHVHEAIFGQFFPSEEITTVEVYFWLEGIDNWINEINHLDVSNKLNISKDYNFILQKHAGGIKFKLSSHNPQLLSEYRKIIQKIILFFYFILNKPTNLQKIIIKSAGNKKLPIYYQSIPFNHKKYPSKSGFIQPGDIDNLPRIIENWFNFYDSYSPVVHLYFSFLTNTHSFAETKFISLSQALEAYHRLSGYNQD
ncbi:TPA: hypothetical protein RGG70_001308, partial [Legionella pneumophila]|nr:hypothetical protein [Legionella pneumophila]HDU8594477.1 hypothetical protein [Legionella pneumophila]